MIDKNRYLLTGEFAKLMNVTKNTLFHYDNIGLFSPKIKEENGYRYYAIQQAGMLDAILMLRDLGMPLDKIKEYLSDKSADKLLEMFNDEEDIIDRQIEKLLNQKKWIEHRRKMLNFIEDKDLNEIDIEECDKRFCIKRISESSEPIAFSKEFAILKNIYADAKLTNTYKVGYIQYDKDIDKKIYDNYHEIMLVMDSKPIDIECDVIKEGTYVSAYHKGHWSKIGDTYERLEKYISDNNIKTDGIYLETDMTDELVIESFEDYIIKIETRIVE